MARVTDFLYLLDMVYITLYPLDSAMWNKTSKLNISCAFKVVAETLGVKYIQQELLTIQYKP